MTSLHQFTFGQFTFVLSAGGDDTDGVIVPVGVDTSAAGFTEALQKALAFYPVFYAHCYFEYGIIFYMRHGGMSSYVKRLTSERLRFDMDKMETLLNQDHYEITFYMREYSACLIKEHERRQEKPIILDGTRPGWVYLLKETNGTHYKIGRTSNPNNRLKTFKVKLPFKVKYICTIKTTDMYALEAALHERFADKRVDGEWFDLKPEDVQYIMAMGAKS